MTTKPKRLVRIERAIDAAGRKLRHVALEAIPDALVAQIDGLCARRRELLAESKITDTEQNRYLQTLEVWMHANSYDGDPVRPARHVPITGTLPLMLGGDMPPRYIYDKPTRAGASSDFLAAAPKKRSIVRRLIGGKR